MDESERPTRASSCKDEEATADTASVSGPAADQEKTLERGTPVGRYLIVSVLGVGGMGVVYAAYDPDLDRRVALKLIRTRQRSAAGRTRALREAQAMAKLSHANVVNVYDVGTFQGHIFIAMELVGGGTLRDWLDAKERSWRAIVDLFLQVGRGLAAAHESDLVHRDIKPSNILIDEKGIPHVVDFGVVRLAHRYDAEPTPPPPDLDSKDDLMESEDRDTTTSGSQSALGTPLTEVGAAVGTPAYMAPEQRRGTADARSDQFGFCMTLHEALYGSRPNKGPTDRYVPGWVRRVLERGLSRKPKRRFASMEALVDELSRDPRARWRRVGVVAAFVALAGTSVAIAASLGDSDQKPCQGAERMLAEVWDDDVKRSVRAAFAATDRRYAGDTYDRVAKALDGRAAAWLAMRTEACEATRVRGDQSEQLMDLRVSCLDRRLGEMRALTRVFADEADGKVVDNAVKAAMGLSDLDRCADTEALTAAFPPPSDPKVGARVDALRERLEAAGALGMAGKFKEGLTIATPAAREAASIDYPPIEALALFRLGSLQQRAGDPATAATTLYEAAARAAAAHDDVLAAEIMGEIVLVIGYRQARFEAGLAIGPLAEAAVRRAGNNPMLRANAINSQGLALWAKGALDEAKARFEESLSLWEEARGPDDPGVARAASNLGIILADQGHYAQAEKQFERAGTILETALGPAHPDVASAVNNRGYVLVLQRRHDEARACLERALASREASLGSDHFEVATTLINLGLLAGNEGNLDEATRHLERSTAIFEKALGPDHPQVARPLNNLGMALSDAGKCDQAVVRFERALAILEKAFGPEHPDVAHPLNGLGICYATLGKPTRGIAFLRRALAIREASAGDPNQLALTRFALAQALWEAGRDRKRALALAWKARDVFAKGGENTKEPLEEVEAWLAERRPP